MSPMPPVDRTAILDESPEALALYEMVRNFIESLGEDVEVVQRKTQVTFKAKRGFAFLWRPLPGRNRPENSIVLTFDSDHRIEDVRIVEAVEPRAGHWTHHVIIDNASDLDETVKAWLREAYALGRIDRRGRRKQSDAPKGSSC